MIPKAISFLFDLLFPPRCMICHRLTDSSSVTVCDACLNALPEFDGAEPSVRFSSKTCVSFFYEEDFRKSFLRYKFADRKEYAHQFGKWMSITVSDKLNTEFDVLTFVPVSRKRRKERGYDQAELLCRQISEELGIAYRKLLKKSRHTKPQSSLRDRSARSANASGAYQITDPSFADGKRILLIDDIITTGATLSECCRVLQLAGAKSICCAALATPRDGAERENP